MIMAILTIVLVDYRYIWFLLFFLRTPEFRLDPEQRNRDWLLARSLFIAFIAYALIMMGIGYVHLLMYPENCSQ